MSIGPVGFVINNAMPPRHPNDDDDNGDDDEDAEEEKEDLEPAIIREPDEDNS